MIPSSQAGYTSEGVRGLHEGEGNKLAELFFSRTNINALQLGMRNLVFAKSGGKHVISDQSEQELFIIMRSVYAEHAIQRTFAIVEEVRRLNGIVLSFAVPQILGEIDMHMRYLHDSSNTPNYMSHAENTNIKGSKGLEMKPFF